MYDNIFQEPRHLQNFKNHPVFAVWSEVDKSLELKKSEASNSSSSSSSNPASFFSQPSQILKSRINERDIYGYSLLHYAAILGDESLCERLLVAGADPNLIYYDDALPLTECKKSPLYLALARGHSKVAARLLPVTNKIGISNSHLGDSQSKESVAWYKNAIYDALMISYPNCKQNDWTFVASSTFFKESAMPIKSESTEEEFKKFNDLIYRVCELGEVNILRNLLAPLLTNKEGFKDWLSSQKFGDFPEDKNFLHAAVCSGSIETVEFLLSENICSLNAPRTENGQLSAYKTTALMMAVKQKNSEMAKVLLQKGANVNDKDKKQWTLLMFAMRTNDISVVRLLWEASTDETLLLKNMDGQTILHIAAQYTNNGEVWNFIREKLGDKFKAQMEIPDKYGFSVLDWAFFQKNTAALRCFDETKNAQEFEKDSRYGVFPISTQQLKIEKKIQYRLKLKGRSLTYLAKDKDNEEALHGLCNGMTFLKTYYNKKFGSKYFPHVKKLMAEWDGSLKNLEKPFEKIDPFYHVFKEIGYKNLDDLMEQWTNDLIYFWGGGVLESEIDPSDRTTQFKGIAPTQYQGNIDQVNTLYNDQDKMASIDFSDNLKRWLQKTSGELAEIIQYFSKLPIEYVLEISDSNHIVEITSNAASIIDCSDPNQFYELAPNITPEEAAQHIYDYLYVRRRQGNTNKLYNITRSYTFESNKNIDHLTEVDLFGQNGVPHTSTEIQIFQKKSPNQFTPLHVSAMLHQNKILEDLLKNPLHDINAFDSREFTPLTMAILMNNETGASLMFQHPTLSFSNLLSNINNSVKLDRLSAFQSGIKALSQRFTHLETPEAIRELVLCLKSIQNVYYSEPEKRLAYLKTFIKSLPVPIAHQILQTAFVKPPFNEYCLNSAFRGANQFPIARLEEFKLLLNAGADLFFIAPKNPLMRNAPIETIVGFLYEPTILNEIIEHLKQKNTLDKCDAKGNSILHYAVNALNVEAVLNLIKAGAKIMNKGEKENTVFNLMLLKLKSEPACVEKDSYNKCLNTLFAQAMKEQLSSFDQTILEKVSKEIMTFYEKVTSDKWPQAFYNYCQKVHNLQPTNFKFQ